MDIALTSRHAAVDIVATVLERQQPLDVALRALDEHNLEGKDRAFARLMAMTVLRHLQQINALIGQLLHEPMPQKQEMVMQVLRISAAQLIWLRTPPHAAVNSAVELTKKLGHGKASGVVNAVLKKLSQQGDDMAAQQDSERLHLPDWLWNSWVEAYGEEEVRQIIRTQCGVPPLDIYAPHDVEGWAAQLEGEPIYGNTLRRANASVEMLAGYDEGAWWVQDVAASLPVALLGDVTDKTVLDVCAAPGGKTAQLVKAGAQVVALDRSRNRLKRLKENMQRLNCDVKVVTADVMQWQPDEAYSAILLDAPCSATGTIRRHPDLLHQKSQEDVAAMMQIQAAMLPRVCEWLAPGGTLIYCVCSLQPEEGEQQVQAFLKANPDMQLQPITEGEMPPEWIVNGMLRTLPSMLHERGGMDGFFAARLQKR